MFLLRFAFENYLSFRDEVDLTFVEPRLRKSRPHDGAWLDYTTRVSAIYGANASGKSGLIDALRYMRDCVRDSAGGWSGRKKIPRAPFALDENSRNSPSSFSLDFAIDDVRYEYGFSISATQVEEEWLYTFPKGRKRIVFERNAAEASEIQFGREIGAGASILRQKTGNRELVLSKGHVFDHPLLSSLYSCIVEQIDIASFGEFDRQGRLRQVISDVAQGSLDIDDLRTMLRVADIGISDASVEEQEADPRAKRTFLAVLEAQQEDNDDVDVPSEEELEEILAELARTLTFEHLGVGRKTYSLGSSNQSTGTLTWLSLAAPAISTIRTGGVLAVDELDASLHPQLAQVMIQMFRDRSVNQSGAQLIFTTHDTYFISPTSEVNLNADEVWIVEKGRNGVSDLFRLSDFSTRKDQNFSRRYLQGRYGGVPSVAPSFLAELARSQDEVSTAEIDLEKI